MRNLQSNNAIDLLLFLFLSQLLKGYVDALKECGASNQLQQSSDTKNAWYKAFMHLYHPVLGPARAFEKPAGKDAVKNFKKKTVNSLWPKMYERVLKKTKNKEDIQEYEFEAASQFQKFQQLEQESKEHSETKKNERAKLHAQMAAYEREHGAIPPGANGAIQKNTLLLVNEDIEVENHNPQSPWTTAAAASTPYVCPTLENTPPVNSTGSSRASPGTTQAVPPMNGFGGAACGSMALLGGGYPLVANSGVASLVDPNKMAEDMMKAKDRLFPTKDPDPKRQKTKHLEDIIQRLRDAETHAKAVGDPLERINKIATKRRELEDELLFTD